MGHPATVTVLSPRVLETGMRPGTGAAIVGGFRFDFKVADYIIFELKV